MLSREIFDQMFGFLTDAMQWRVSNEIADMFFDRLSSVWVDNDFMNHAMAFCDRGRGTPADFMSYLKDERRRKHQDMQDAKKTEPRANDAQLLSPAQTVHAWESPPLGQLKIAKMMALRKKGWIVSFGQIELEVEDMEAIEQGRLDGIMPMQALLARYQENSDRKAKSTSGMTAIGECF